MNIPNEVLANPKPKKQIKKTMHKKEITTSEEEELLSSPSKCLASTSTVHTPNISDAAKKFATRIQTDGLLRESILTSTLQSGAVTDSSNTNTSSSTPTKPKTGSQPTINSFIASTFSSNVNTSAELPSTVNTNANAKKSKSKDIDILPSTSNASVCKSNTASVGAANQAKQLIGKKSASNEYRSNFVKKGNSAPNSVSAGKPSTTTNEIGANALDNKLADRNSNVKRKRTRRGGVKNRAYLEKRAKDKLFQRANEEYAQPSQNPKGTQKRNRTHGETPPDVQRKTKMARNSSLSGASATQTSQKSMSAAVKDAHLLVAIIDMPIDGIIVPLSKEKYNLIYRTINTFLAEEIKKAIQIPTFEENMFVRGVMRIRCSTQGAKNWLASAIQYIPQMWENMKLVIGRL